ncbi:MAG: CoA transferase [Actinomycetota bacterium]|nr:CoA transferase [Actinomycetota bacterium]
MTAFQPLRGLRVLDLADEKGELCGRLLADLGADVLRVEPPEGAISRSLPPFAPNGTSLYFAYRNFNKRSAILDAQDSTDRARLLELAAEADVFVESFSPGYLAERAIGPDELQAANPDLVVVSLTDFGQTGPDREYVATDDVIFARSGWLAVSGIPERPPLLAPGSIAYDALGVLGAYASLLGLVHRDRGMGGQHLDVSALEALSQMNSWGIPNASASHLQGAPAQRVRSGDSPLYPHIPCADGHIRQVILAPRQWRALWEWMGSPDAFSDEYWESTFNRYMNLDVLNPAFWDHWADRQMVEGCAEAQDLGVVATPMLKPSDILDNPHYRSRETFLTREVADGVTGPVMAGFAEVDARRVGYRHSAPKLGEHEASFSEERFAKPEQPEDPAELPLTGLRVVDFGHGGVGVECGRMLAEYGADVIKVESWDYPDFIRIVLGGVMTASFASSSRTKRGFGANLKDPEGRAVVLDLVSGADIVIENNSTGTMDALGVGYEHLSGIRPGLIMLSSQLMGSRGKFSGWTGYGPTLQTVGGLSWLWAFDDGEPPPGSPAIHPDHLAGRVCAVFALAGLLHRNRGGGGNHTEIAQVEALLATLGDLLLLEGLQPGAVRPEGNDSARGAPWGVFQCVGDEEWCVVCVRNDSDWARLVEAMGRPDGSDSPDLVTSAARIAKRERVNALVSDWAAGLSAFEVEEICQSHGVPAGRVLAAVEQMEDPHLLERGFLARVEQPGVGEIVLEGPCITGSKMGPPVITPAPLLGEHTRQICLEELGMDPMRFEELVANGSIEVLGTES